MSKEIKINWMDKNILKKNTNIIDFPFVKNFDIHHGHLAVRSLYSEYCNIITLIDQDNYKKIEIGDSYRRLNDIYSEEELLEGYFESLLETFKRKFPKFIEELEGGFNSYRDYGNFRLSYLLTEYSDDCKNTFNSLTYCYAFARENAIYYSTDLFKENFRKLMFKAILYMIEYLENNKLFTYLESVERYFLLENLRTYINYEENWYLYENDPKFKNSLKRVKNYEAMNILNKL
ncbi:hypothetical protein PBI_PBS1_215 [Bacillus phage PBS1]|uniref:Uncharacterized protein n=1 Tax=Bacillus phage PBS1 TaxID=2884423 RepID=A0A223LCU4_BPPB1|nr:hypothetical protein FK780_gp232 [Bacillus phage PBS1]ASU00037.1 hypothetical protein PBI_PBS1_215 [Bacillus phage PBS1]BDE75449.1 hypothetical protein [Bacillus phage PBS1]